MGSRLIIFDFIVGLRGLCGTLSSPGLVSAGSCLALSKTYMQAGGRVAVQGVRLFGKWFHFVLCGASGGSVMIGALRTNRDPIRNSSICSSLLFSLGLRGGWPHK
jgi:hypothetical protein